MRATKWLFALVVLAALAAAGCLAWFATQPQPLPRAPFDFTVKSGAGIGPGPNDWSDSVDNAFVDCWTGVCGGLRSVAGSLRDE